MANQTDAYKIYVVGMGPGSVDMMTPQAQQALREADVIVGYTVYLELLTKEFPGKPLLSTPMRKETERCELCFAIAEKGLAAADGKAKIHGGEKAKIFRADGLAENAADEGSEISAMTLPENLAHPKTIAMVCSGDAGVYGMASLMFEIGKEHPAAELEIIPGITAALSGGAVLGSPLSNDFCTISLSDYLTPWSRIEKRLLSAAEGDFSIALYNPSSHKRKDYLQRACDILLRVLPPERACGYVENIGREGTTATVCTLGELRDREVNMFTTVFIGNSTGEIWNGKLLCKRGYPAERNEE
ncbi:MAG: precorrin-3B C(17)-methyltransferase [Lachnospiraceae bacterium]|nr:precorrin-3B C(17)-methyltransferase [Lachnospiraceae bacterium]